MYHLKSALSLLEINTFKGATLNKLWNQFSKSNTVPKFPYSTCPQGMKVTICGAAGNTGQPLALLLKQCPLLDEIALYDICPTCGYGMELSHVDTKCKISSYSGRHMLCDALKGSNVVVIVARNGCDSFENSAPVLTELTMQICNTCPETFTIVGTEPVESMVPLVSEIQRLRGVYNPRKVLGCVELNCVRANTVLADFLHVPPEQVRVPVVGGATPGTMVPVLSAAVHPGTMTQEQVECVTSCIMSGNEAVCAAKGCCAATACLAGAYALARNTVNVVKGLQGGKVTQCAYVDCLGTCAPNCQFFANDRKIDKLADGSPDAIFEELRKLCQLLTVDKRDQCVGQFRKTKDTKDKGAGKKVCRNGHPVILGATGIEKNLGVPELSKFENCLLCNSIPYVRNEIARAVWLVYTMCQQYPCTPLCVPCPSECYTQPPVPCVPPTNWTCDYPDSCRDEYLASICREMTCRCGSTELYWIPRDFDYETQRQSKGAHLMAQHGDACSVCRIPRSIRMEQQIRDRAMTPTNV